MKVLGIDIGGKTRTALCLMDDGNIVDYTYIKYDNKSTPLNHREKINLAITTYEIRHYIDYILFERINLYRGRNVSPLANIISLCRVQTTIINKFSNSIVISDVPVKSWKSKVLGSGNATKQDAIDYVKKYYPDVDLNILVEHKRKDNEIIENHDLADAILIAKSAFILGEDYLIKNKLNYK